MHVLIYTSTALPKLGGQEHVVDALARELSRRGHTVGVLAPAPRSPLVADDLALGQRGGYKVLRHPRFVSTRWFVGSYGRFLRRAAGELGGVDVVHCHDTYPTGWIAVREKIAPVVITSHGGDLNEGNIRIVKRGIAARCAETLEGAAGLISIGRFTEANFRRVSPKLPPITTIPNGVDLTPPSELRKPDGLADGPFVLFLGRLHRRKGVDVLLEAARLAEGVRVAVVGDGDLRAELQEKARGLGERVVFLGRRMGAEKAWLLANARAVVMPSRGWEAFPLVVLEAAAAGRAVIASRIPGLEDLVADGETGRLVPEGDAPALAAALVQAWDDPALAEVWGRTALARVGRYAWDRVAAEHEAVYERVLSGPR